jgi:hypothetical protein
MGDVPKTIVPVKLFSGIILSSTLARRTILSALEADFGPIDYVSREMDFCRYTTYYNREMGDNLSRCFVSFANLIDRTGLPDIKIKTNAIERAFRKKGKRQVNLDPGYLTLGQIFLASTKDNFFRIYLRDAIFAEVTLYYERGKYISFPWTYRDYDSTAYKEIFLKIRSLYKNQL